MSNTLLTMSQITKEAMLELKNQLVMAKSVTREYDDQFAKKGAKIGSVANIRKPAKYVVNDGPTLVVQDHEQTSVAVTIDKQKHVGMQFTSKDLTLSIDEFRDLIIKPAIAPLVNQVDKDLLALYVDVYNCAGTPGTTPADLQPYLEAKRRLAHAGAPVGLKRMVIDPLAEAVIINALSGKFHSSEQIKKQYENGEMGLAAGFDWAMAQNVAIHTCGTQGGTPAVNGTTAEGASSLVTDGWSNSITDVLKAGDVFTIAGVYAVNPQTKATLSVLKQFVVTADVDSDGSGNSTLSISPAIYASGKDQNVSALPANDALLTVVGASAVVSPANLAFAKQAFALACVDLEMPSGVDKAARVSDPESGLSLRMVRDYDINNDRFPCRLDIMYGVKTLYPELACRVMG